MREASEIELDVVPLQIGNGASGIGRVRDVLFRRRSSNAVDASSLA